MMIPNPGSDETLIHVCYQGNAQPPVYLHDLFSYMLIDGKQVYVQHCPYCGVNIEEDAYGASAFDKARKNGTEAFPLTILSREAENDATLAQAVDILQQHGINTELKPYWDTRAGTYWSVEDVDVQNRDWDEVALTRSEMEKILLGCERAINDTTCEIGNETIQSAIRSHADEREKLTLKDLQTQWPNWKEAVIVFCAESFEDNLPEIARAYSVSSKDKYWDASQSGTGVFGHFLNGQTAPFLQLNEHLQQWRVDHCYIVE